MKGIVIKTKTEKGREAVARHIIEKKKERGIKAQFYKKWFKETIVSTDPLVFEIRLLNPMLSGMSFEAFKSQISETLFKNGAVLDDDYGVDEIG